MVTLDELINLLEDHVSTSGHGAAGREIGRWAKEQPDLDLRRYIDEILPLLTDNEDKVEAIIAIFPLFEKQPLKIDVFIEKLIIPINDDELRGYVMLHWMMESDHLEIKRELIEALNTGQSPENASVKKISELLKDKDAEVLIRAGWASLPEAGYSIQDLEAFHHRELRKYPNLAENIDKRWFLNQLKNPENLVAQINNVNDPVLQKKSIVIATSVALDNRLVSYDFFKKFLDLIDKKDLKKYFIGEYINQSKSNNEIFNSEVLYLCLLLFSDEPPGQVKILELWFDKNEENEDVRDELEKVLPLIPEGDEKKKFITKLNIREIKTYFTKTQDDKIDIKHALKLLSNIDSINDRILLVRTHKEFLNLSVDEQIDAIFANILPGSSHINNNEIFQLPEWLGKNQGLSIAQYRKILMYIDNNDTDHFNNRVLECCKVNLENKFELFIIIAKKLPFELLYDSYQIYQMFFLNSHTNSMAEYKFIIPLCQQLYPGAEYAQIDLFKQALSDINIPPLQKIILLKEFASGLREDDSCIEIIEYALGRKINITPMDILELSKTRISSRFESLRQVLDGVTLDEAILPDQWPIIKNLFGDTLSKDSTLLGVFSYYDLHGKLNEFHKLLNENIQDKIQLSYQSPVDTAFIMPEERDKLIKLKIMAPGVNDLPKMISLCHYLKKREETFLKIPPVEESLHLLVMMNLATMSSKNKSDTTPEIEYKRKFMALISKLDTATSTEIIDFFKEITGLELKGEEHKLTTLLKDRAKELAFLFSKPNGISDYLAIIHSIGEGCAANIGTKTNMYILGKLFKDPIDKIVFPFYCENIFNAIANLPGRDILGSNVAGSDIFSNYTVINTYLSPRGLVEGLAAELKRLPKISNELLEKLLTGDERVNYFDNIIDYPDSESKQARVVCYLILREILPKEDWQNPHFNFIKKEVEGIIYDQDNLQLKLDT